MSIFSFLLTIMTELLESTQYRGWDHSGTPTVMKECLERLSKSGWDDVRPALSITVR